MFCFRRRYLLLFCFDVCFEELGGGRVSWCSAVVLLLAEFGAMMGKWFNCQVCWHFCQGSRCFPNSCPWIFHQARKTGCTDGQGAVCWPAQSHVYPSCWQDKGRMNSQTQHAGQTLRRNNSTQDSYSLDVNDNMINMSWHPSLDTVWPRRSPVPRSVNGVCARSQIHQDVGATARYSQPAGVDADSVVPASAEELNDEIEAMRSIYGWKLRTLVYPWVRNFALRCIDLYCSCCWRET